MDSLMAETVQEKHWYLAVGDRSIGPLTTELVARGIRSGKVPLTAWICQVGANTWSALSSFGEFQDIVDLVLAAEVPANQQSRERSGTSVPGQVAAPAVVETTLQAPGSIDPGHVSMTAVAQAVVPDEDEPTGQHSLLPYEQPESLALPSFSQEVDESDFVTSADPVPTSVLHARDELPSFAEQSGSRQVMPEVQAIVAARAAARISHDDLSIDITFDEDHENSIDWKERFQSYFLVGTEVELPEERKLLQSLRETPRATFLQDEALWNLSLCLAFGSDEVAVTSARTFFEAVGPDHAPERIEWVCRTLLSKGFMPSGIPRSEGMRGVEVLRGACPLELGEVLDREAVD
jgi:hypothetical protein